MMTPEQLAEVFKRMTEQLAEVFKRMTERALLEIAIGPLEAFSLIGCLQLAWRHPALSAEQKALIEAFVRQLRPLFQDEPLVLELIEMGWDPAHDYVKGGAS